MALLVARQCRLLGATLAPARALLRLRRPAVAVPFRSFGLLGNEPPRKSNVSHSKLDASHSKKQRQETGYPSIPTIEESEIVPVNSAILVPASVTAAVSAPTALWELPLICAETRAFH